MPTWRQIKDDQSLWDIFYFRQEIISLVREYFHQQNFLELFTPILVPSVIPESYVDIFTTTLLDRNLKKNKRFLIPSPEVSIKKLLVAGLSKCFEIARVFRNRESGSSFHYYEFTSLEWYRTQASYLDILEDCQNLIIYIFQKLKKKYPKRFNKKYLNIQNYKIDLSLPWQMITVSQALKKFCQISFDEITDRNNKKNFFPLSLIRKIAFKKGYKVEVNNTWEEIFNQIYLNEIEPYLGTDGRPTIIYDYPAPVAALAKLKKDDKRIAERFEVYFGRIELADCCTELTDYKEQKKRFRQNLLQIKKNGKNPIIADLDFLEALKSGLPDCAGIALGVDRLIMILGNYSFISDTLLTYN